MEKLAAQNGWRHVGGRWTHFCVDCGCVSSGQRCADCYGKVCAEGGKRREEMDVSRAIAKAQKLGASGLMAQAALLAGAVEKAGSKYKGQKLKHLPRGGKLLAISQLIFAGCSLREIRKKTGAHTGTIARVRKFFEKFVGRAIPCPCGRPASHQGWCSARYQRSPGRQSFMKNWSRNKTTVALRQRETDKAI